MKASRAKAFGRLALTLVVCAALLAAFAYFVWPTPWRYDIGRGNTELRVSRLTGEVYVRYPGTTWVRPSSLHTTPMMLASVQRYSECTEHTRNLARALELYVETHADLPPRQSWMDAILPSLSEAGLDHRVLQCPARPRLRAGYALNTGACGLNHGRVHDKHGLVVFFESSAGWNAAGGRELLPDRPRHFRFGTGGDNYGFADGSARWLRRKQNPDGTYAKEPAADWVRWEVEAQ